MGRGVAAAALLAVAAAAHAGPAAPPGPQEAAGASSAPAPGAAAGTPAAPRPPMPVFTGFRPDLNDRQRVEMLTEYAYFDEAVAEIRRLDAGKFAGLRRRWAEVAPDHRAILESPYTREEALRKVPWDARSLAEDLESWQLFVGTDSVRAAARVEDWVERVERRRRQHRLRGERYGLPGRFHMKSLVEYPADLDKDAVPEIYVFYWVPPEGRIDRGGIMGPAGRLSVKAVAKGGRDLGTVRLGESIGAQPSFYDLGTRGVLIIECPVDAEILGTRYVAVSLDDDGRLYQVSLVDGDRRLPFAIADGAGPGIGSMVDFNESGTRVKVSLFEATKREIILWYQWDGLNYVKIRQEEQPFLSPD